MSGTRADLRYEEVPPIMVSLRNLPPRSVTYLRIYHGLKLPDPRSLWIVESSYVFGNGHAPQDLEITVRDCDIYCVKEGPTTVEIVQQTPGSTALLSSLVIRVDRTITMEWNYLKAERQAARRKQIAAIPSPRHPPCPPLSSPSCPELDYNGIG